MSIICEHVHRLKLRLQVFGLLWQRSTRFFGERPVYQLFMSFLFWTCMSENKFRTHFLLNWQMRNTKIILVCGHVHI